MRRIGLRVALASLSGLSAKKLAQPRAAPAYDAQSNTISSVSTELYRVPLSEVLVDAKHGNHSHFELLVVKVIKEDGSEGVGYTYTGGKGGRAIYSLVEDELKPMLIGKDASRIEKLCEAMEWHIHYVARGGCASFAVSAVDIALWDLRCKQAGQPLWRMAGGYDNSTKCYAGGIDLAYSLERLVDNVTGYLVQGHTAVKIKLGKERLEEDLARVRAVRAAVGDDCTFMVDANMKYSVDHAIKAAKALQDSNVFWLEEPTIPDDFDGYERIREEGGLAIAQGENLHTLFEFQRAARAKVDFLQPDCSNIGGVTNWLKVAHLAEAFNLPVSSHGMQELHVSLMSAVRNSGWMEVHSFPIDEYTKRPLAGHIKDGRAYAPDTPGTGVEFDFNKLAPYRVL